ncbi:hypothetical protein BN946_scf184979.g36 [Trametes cinnabarina]|uniref:Uncharacterized protein n=1 Tax=Pycnoporus cinnabarinus TaxID=5643 RepID=A0A060SJX0_PYCCI|nr:hypothetical protein BN946_scf184979.g36 [Trametes cinnabarina]
MRNPTQVRYYTLAALIFDVAQIHSFSHFQPSLNTCVWMDAMIRVVGALSLWGVEIVMQLRIYALYRLSKRVAIVNAVLFVVSVAGFLWILVHNGLVRASVIAQAKSLPIPGCPVVHTGIEWAQWVPATIYEGILFGYALWKAGENFVARLRRADGKLVTRGWRPTLYSVVLSDNLLYFFFIACILTFNNLMVVGVTHIPWFSYGTGTSELTRTINLDETLQWNVAAGSSGAETFADLENVKESYEMKHAGDKSAVQIYEVSPAGLEGHPSDPPVNLMHTFSEDDSPHIAYAV